MIEDADTMQLGRPEVIFELPFRTDNWRTYDIAPDGSRFLMAFANNQSGRGSKIVVVKNFFGELERLAPAGGELTKPGDANRNEHVVVRPNRRK